jgi:hypothetical protein
MRFRTWGPFDRPDSQTLKADQERSSVALRSNGREPWLFSSGSSAVVLAPSDRAMGSLSPKLLNNRGPAGRRRFKMVTYYQIVAGLWLKCGGAHPKNYGGRRRRKMNRCDVFLTLVVDSQIASPYNPNHWPRRFGTDRNAPLAGFAPLFDEWCSIGKDRLKYRRR